MLPNENRVPTKLEFMMEQAAVSAGKRIYRR